MEQGCLSLCAACIQACTIIAQLLCAGTFASFCHSQQAARDAFTRRLLRARTCGECSAGSSACALLPLRLPSCLLLVFLPVHTDVSCAQQPPSRCS